MDVTADEEAFIEPFVRAVINYLRGHYPWFDGAVLINENVEEGISAAFYKLYCESKNYEISPPTDTQAFFFKFREPKRKLSTRLGSFWRATKCGSLITN